MDVIGKMPMRGLKSCGVPKLEMKTLVCPLRIIKIQLVVPYNVSLLSITECIPLALAKLTVIFTKVHCLTLP